MKVVSVLLIEVVELPLKFYRCVEVGVGRVTTFECVLAISDRALSVKISARWEAVQHTKFLAKDPNSSRFFGRPLSKFLSHRRLAEQSCQL